jgi:hypothetical protein
LQLGIVHLRNGYQEFVRKLPAYNRAHLRNPFPCGPETVKTSDERRMEASQTTHALAAFHNHHDFERMAADVLNAL